MFVLVFFKKSTGEAEVHFESEDKDLLELFAVSFTNDNEISVIFDKGSGLVESTIIGNGFSPVIDNRFDGMMFFEICDNELNLSVGDLDRQME